MNEIFLPRTDQLDDDGKVVYTSFSAYRDDLDRQGNEIAIKKSIFVAWLLSAVKIVSRQVYCLLVCMVRSPPFWLL